MEETPKITVNAEVVLAIKKLQVLHKNDASKIIKDAAQEKSAKDNLIFLIDLAIVAGDTKPIKDEPQIFNEAWDHPNQNCKENVKKPFGMNLGTWAKTGMEEDTEESYASQWQVCKK